MSLPCSRCGGLGHDKYVHPCEFCISFLHESHLHPCTESKRKCIVHTGRDCVKDPIVMLQGLNLVAPICQFVSECDQSFGCEICGSTMHLTNRHPCRICANSAKAATASNEIFHSESKHQCVYCLDLNHSSADHLAKTKSSRYCLRCLKQGHDAADHTCRFCDFMDHSSQHHQCKSCFEFGHVEQRLGFFKDDFKADVFCFRKPVTYCGICKQFGLHFDADHHVDEHPYRFPTRNEYGNPSYRMSDGSIIKIKSASRQTLY